MIKIRTDIRSVLRKTKRDEVCPETFNQRVSQYEREEREFDIESWRAKQQSPFTRRMQSSKETIFPTIQPTNYGEKKVSDFNKALAELRKKAKN